MKTIIQLHSLSKVFQHEFSLQPISLAIDNQEFITLLGPSGCGKTTLLRLIAGFEQPDQGSIWLNGEDITKLPPEQRHINMVFQNYALFPHMTVLENVAFGLRCQKLSEQEIQSRVTQALTMVKLLPYAKRKPAQLSGGQQQRIAIARAIVNKPHLVLLDEPLSALDYKLRKSMRIELKQLQRDLGITFILVTHDQEEALTMSDRIVVMNEGDIEQIGTPRDIYEEPNSLFVAKFIGETNIFETKVESTSKKSFSAKIENKLFQFTHNITYSNGQPVSIIFRPEDIRVWDDTEVNDTSTMLPGYVEQVIYKGSTVDLVVRLQSGRRISASEFFDEDDEDLDYHLNEHVWIQWQPGWEVVLT